MQKPWKICADLEDRTLCDILCAFEFALMARICIFLPVHGVNNKYTPGIKKFAQAFAVVVPLAFAFIAIYHHLNPITH